MHHQHIKFEKCYLNIYPYLNNVFRIFYCYKAEYCFKKRTRKEEGKEVKFVVIKEDDETVPETDRCRTIQSTEYPYLHKTNVSR